VNTATAGSTLMFGKAGMYIVPTLYSIYGEFASPAEGGTMCSFDDMCAEGK
jgi:hypothetical protein